MRRKNLWGWNRNCRLVLFAALALVACQAKAAREAAQNEDAKERKTFDDFLHRVNAYVKLRGSLEATLSKLKATDQPEKIVEHSKALSEKLLSARKDAKPGDIFTKEISEQFQKQINLEFRGQRGREARRTIRQGEPVEFRAHVDHIYPANMPLTTVPPTLLFKLPKLPRDIEYRIIGRDFALLDAKTRMVIDFIPEAIPSPPI